MRRAIRRKCSGNGIVNRLRRAVHGAMWQTTQILLPSGSRR